MRGCVSRLSVTSELQSARPHLFRSPLTSSMKQREALRG